MSAQTVIVTETLNTQFFARMTIKLTGYPGGITSPTRIQLSDRLVVITNGLTSTDTPQQNGSQKHSYGPQDVGTHHALPFGKQSMLVEQSSYSAKNHDRHI